jgi:hypothetical protein
METTKWFWRVLLVLMLIATLGESLAFPDMNQTAKAAPQMQTAVSHLVISQVYGGGGETGASYTNDFIELFNPSDVSVPIDGWSVQYADTGGTGQFSANVTNLSGMLQPGQYYLVQLAGGTNGQPLPTPIDATGTVNLSAGNGMVILANTATGLPCNNNASCTPYLANIVDLVGYGNANYFEGSSAAPGPSNNASAVVRNGSGCFDTNNNNQDFLAAASNPHNTASSPILSCTNQFLTATVAVNLTATAAANQTATASAAPTNTQTPSSTPTVARSVLINEVAWGGTKASSSDEWFELYNTTGADINLNGWTLSSDDGALNIPLSGTITAADPYFVFARNSNVFQDFVPNKIYSGASFNNNGQILYLLDLNGNEVDTANLDGGAWNAGQGSPNFASMERNGTGPDSPTSWTTYGGTVAVAHDRNGNDIKGTPGQANWISVITPTPTPTITPTGTITPTSTSSPKVLINEVAWSGTSATTTDDEWIELYNPGTSPIDITGWALYGDDNTLNKVGSPNITLKGTIPAGGYFLLEKNEAATSVTANQVYSTGDLLNSGERLYLKEGKTIIDTANLDGGAWPAGTSSVTTTYPPPYASMERVAGTSNMWVTYGGNQPIAYDRNGGPIKGTPGSANWINSATITTITSDLPDPSLVKQNVTVYVSVIGGKSIPTGKVNITGANTNCSFTLNSSGTGYCVVNFTSAGTKTLIASYVPNTAAHVPSSDTESHQVRTSSTIYPTTVPTSVPPPPLLAINEFVPRPGHDWNHDGVVNSGDEFIEVLNHGVVNVNLSGYSLDDEVNVGSDPYRLPALTLRPGERHVFYGSETGILLGDGGDAVRLQKPNGQLADAYNYSVVERPDQSFCRLPDNGGADDWNTNCYPTPGLQNSQDEGDKTASNTTTKELYCPIADTLPDAFVQAECEPFGNNIWRPEFWDQTGWYDNQVLPGIDTKWPVFAN